ncbi:hypothetical protein G9A89_010034 [Geosiphon pyriformis]|nr:hypothetical protein G9A89_010034 [Geosiphon pyriformis]
MGNRASKINGTKGKRLNKFGLVNKRKRDDDVESCLTTVTSDSHLFDENFSSVSTVAESFHEFDGRTYHDCPNVLYHLPCDLEEMDRLAAEHFLWKNLWGDNFSAPIELLLSQKRSKVLDIGCGPGTWILEMSCTYPIASFTGIDLCALQPISIKPQNANFVNSNILNGLPFEAQYFDYLHQRFMLRTMSEKQLLQEVIPELLRVTRFQGVLEFVDSDVHYVDAGPLLRKMTSEYIKYLKSKDINCTFNRLICFLLKTEAVNDTHYEQKLFPMATDSNKLSELVAENEHQIWLALRPILAPQMNITNTGYEQLLEFIFKYEIYEYKTHIRMHRFYATRVRKID